MLFYISDPESCDGSSLGVTQYFPSVLTVLGVNHPHSALGHVLWTSGGKQMQCLRAIRASSQWNMNEVIRTIVSYWLLLSTALWVIDCVLFFLVNFIESSKKQWHHSNDYGNCILVDIYIKTLWTFKWKKNNCLCFYFPEYSFPLLHNGKKTLVLVKLINHGLFCWKS